MNYLQKTLLLFLLLIPLGMMPSCYDPCADTTERHDYQVFDLYISLVKLTPEKGISLYGSGEYCRYEYYQEGDTIEYQQFGIVLIPEIVEITTLTCHPEATHYDKITNIEVSTLTDYNHQYPSHSVINEMVLSEADTYQYITFRGYIPEQTISSFLDSNYRIGSETRQSLFILRLDSPPEDVISINYEVNLTVNDDRTYSVIAKDVIIKP